MINERLHIFDTTLRDGEQSPGATMTRPEKLEVARALARLGVDVIEAGFPAASPNDFSAVRAIARTIGNGIDAPSAATGRPPTICGLARATRHDIDRAAAALGEAAHPRLHVFIATSPIHRKHKLGFTRDQVIASIREGVARAREHIDEVEFSAEDAVRTEHDFLARAFEAAIDAGASIINVPDTVGYTVPREFGELITALRKQVRGIDSTVLSVHCHDDLGLAVANTLAGIEAGARQAEVTINGIGERAGNAALEEVVMAVRCRHDALPLRTGIDPSHLVPTSQLVSRVTGMAVQPNKAIVGENAFAHEAGIHQDGVLKKQETYEIMRPETVGAAGSRLVLGKHSGRHAFKKRLYALGHDVDRRTLDHAFKAFKRLADVRKTVDDNDLIALLSTPHHESEVAT